MRLGIDLGGSKIEAAVLDADGDVCWSQRRPTPQGDYPATLLQLVALVDAAEQTMGCVCSVGIGTPGAETAAGLIKNANSTCLNGRPLRADLQTALQREVRLANDANCFALSEASTGAAQGAQVVFGIILGTGVGGGLVVNGRLWDGCNRIAGEWGHNPLPWSTAAESPGPLCYCGKMGCIEAWLSGPGLAADHLRAGGSVCSAQALVQAAGQGDSLAQATLDRYWDRLARALAALLNVLDPDVVVVGGGLSQVAALYREVPQRWGRYVFSDTVSTRLLPPMHGDSSGVRGAACLWP